MNNSQTDGGTSKKQKRKNNPNIIEGYERKKWETDKQFLNRVERSTHDFVDDQLTKIKYGLVGFEPADILKEGDKKKTKRRRHGDKKDKADDDQDSDDEESMDKKRKKRKKDRGQQSNIDDDQFEKKTTTMSAKAVKRKEKSKEKKQKRKRKAEDDIDPLYMREVIPFGDRADEPPRLTSMPKKAKKVDAARAGSKDLLLKKRLDIAPTTIADGKRRYENDGTIKCDDSAKQRILEVERTRVIEIYRSQKKRYENARSEVNE